MPTGHVSRCGMKNQHGIWMISGCCWHTINDSHMTHPYIRAGYVRSTLRPNHLFLKDWAPQPQSVRMTFSLCNLFFWCTHPMALCLNFRSCSLPPNQVFGEVQGSLIDEPQTQISAPLPPVSCIPSLQCGKINDKYVVI